ncbi:hypothetical protein, partial [Klebsiella pneumoniae]|uniref:hypothetical protein n=1 Tax=Klebsiella pneumoniae TaxID=573 RepID=UPI003EB6FDAB
KRCLSAKKFAHQKYKASNSEEDRNVYNNLRRDAKKLIKQSKKNLEAHIASISKSNPKEFFSFIRKKKVLTPTIGPLATATGEHTNDEIEMAKILNNFF